MFEYFIAVIVNRGEIVYKMKFIVLFSYFYFVEFSRESMILEV